MNTNFHVNDHTSSGNSQEIENKNDPFVNYFKTYFNGFREIVEYNKNSRLKNGIATLKILSYFTVIFPLTIGILYGADLLYHRFSKSNFNNQEKITATAINVILPQNSQEQQQLQLDARSMAASQRADLLNREESKTLAPPDEEQHKRDTSVIQPESGRQRELLQEQHPLIPQEEPVIQDQGLIEEKTLNIISKIQKKYRRHLMRTKLAKNESLLIEKQYFTPINKRVREPLEDLRRNYKWTNLSEPDLSLAQKKITEVAKLGSYSKFKTALRQSFSETLQSINESPVEERKYVILADETGKSTNWCVANVLDMMSKHPPQDIIPKENLKQFLTENPTVKHIVMLDDGAYSGAQASSYIEELEGIQNKKFHISIPYMTNFGKKRIAEALQKQNYEYEMHETQMMLSYQELIEQGKIFSITGKVLINREALSKIKNLTESINLENRENLDQNTITVNESLEELRQMSQSETENDSERLYNKILETIAVIETNLRNQENGSLIKEGVNLIQSLRQCMKKEVDEELGQRLKSAYEANRNKYFKTNLKTKTPSWFSHKGADDVSTNETEMHKISGGYSPPEPYKDREDISKKRMDQINRIKMGMQGRTLKETVIDSGGEHAWLKGKCDFIETNRGFFLLGNSYINETTDSHLILIINQKTIKLGGEEGEYQYRLNKGDIFSLINPITQERSDLKLDQSGKLIPLQMEIS